MVYDLIVIGLGPAGISACIYAKRSGLNILAFEKRAPGGLINTTNLVENYPGYSKIDGPSLAFNMFKHLKDLEVPIKMEEVVKIEKNDNIVITTKNNSYETKTLIIGTGRSPRKPDIEDFNKFEGKGISYCAICDASLYKNKDVCVLGSGDSAFEETLYLSKLCKSVTIVSRSNEIKASDHLQDEVALLKNVKILKNTNIKKLFGENKLEGAILTNEEILNFDALFIYIGFVPISSLFKDVNLKMDKNYILVNNKCETSIPGIFACGDIIKKDLYQIVTATSEGAIAASSVLNYINENVK